MDYPTLRIFALETRNECEARDFIGWGETKLREGRSEVSVLILAGMESSTSYFEAKDAFHLALGELGIEPQGGGDIVLTFLRRSAEEIISGRIDFIEFLRIAHDFGLDESYTGMGEHFQDLSMLHYAFTSHHQGELEEAKDYYPGFNILRLRESVVFECKRLLESINNKQTQ